MTAAAERAPRSAAPDDVAPSDATNAIATASRRIPALGPRFPHSVVPARRVIDIPCHVCPPPPGRKDGNTIRITGEGQVRRETRGSSNGTRGREGTGLCRNCGIQLRNTLRLRILVSAPSDEGVPPSTIARLITRRRSAAPALGRPADPVRARVRCPQARHGTSGFAAGPRPNASLRRASAGTRIRRTDALCTDADAPCYGAPARAPISDSVVAKQLPPREPDREGQDHVQRHHDEVDRVEAGPLANRQAARPSTTSIPFIPSYDDWSATTRVRS